MCFDIATYKIMFQLSYQIYRIFLISLLNPDIQVFTN